MASIRMIRHRIKSAQNIAQITRAMQMVAASKMKKAQDIAMHGKAYADKIYEATRELASRSERSAHPLLSLGNRLGKSLVIVISTNKGLCGGLNTNLFRFISKSLDFKGRADFITVGKKGEQFVAGMKRNLVADFSETIPFSEHVASITQLLVEGFVNGIYANVYIVYNEFINALSQVPVQKQILPLQAFSTDTSDKTSQMSEFVLEPSRDEVLESLLPHYLENQVRAAIFEAEASEHSARMIAMKNATDAANDVKHALTLEYNKARQEKITYEIADIVTARMTMG